MRFDRLSLLVLIGIAGLVLSIFLFAAFFLLSAPLQTENPLAALSPRACFENGSCVELELALSPEEQARGLMFRTRLDPNAGMLFVFSSLEEHPFWMKNTLIRLDIIWLDANARIVGFQENVPLCVTPSCPTYSVGKPSRFVLETNAGFVAENSLRIGQDVTFENILDSN
jgi:uncharacterized membrane protein (UPF0127 family)